MACLLLVFPPPPSLECASAALGASAGGNGPARLSWLFLLCTRGFFWHYSGTTSLALLCEMRGGWPVGTPFVGKGAANQRLGALVCDTEGGSSRHSDLMAKTWLVLWAALA